MSYREITQAYAVGTSETIREKVAYICELRFGRDLSYRDIQFRTGAPMGTIRDYIDKYSARPSVRDVYLTIPSRLNYDDTIEDVDIIGGEGIDYSIYLTT